MSKLKAWVRFDGNKNVVPGSLILRENKPTVGIWKEITYNLCCDGGVTPNVPNSPLYIYDFEITCSDFCLNSIDVNGEPYPFAICETPLDFIGLVDLLQETFPDDTINGVAAIPPNEGGTITIISSKRVFGTIVTENCGSITPVISGLGALRFGFVKVTEQDFVKTGKLSKQPLKDGLSFLLKRGLIIQELTTDLKYYRIRKIDHEEL